MLWTANIGRKRNDVCQLSLQQFPTDLIQIWFEFRSYFCPASSSFLPYYRWGTWQTFETEYKAAYKSKWNGWLFKNYYYLVENFFISENVNENQEKLGTNTVRKANHNWMLMRNINKYVTCQIIHKIFYKMLIKLYFEHGMVLLVCMGLLWWEQMLLSYASRTYRRTIFWLKFCDSLQLFDNDFSITAAQSLRRSCAFAIVNDFSMSFEHKYV